MTTRTNCIKCGDFVEVNSAGNYFCKGCGWSSARTVEDQLEGDHEAKRFFEMLGWVPRWSTPQMCRDCGKVEWVMEYPETGRSACLCALKHFLSVQITNDWQD